jgi:hypothetical protein
MALIGGVAAVFPAPAFAVITEALKDACHDALNKRRYV